MNTHYMKLFRFTNITNSIHAVADLIGARAVIPRWRRWVVLALVAGSAGASHAQFYQPNYITNNAGFEAWFLQAGKSLNYGPGSNFVNGWTYRGDAGIARDSIYKTNALMTDDINGYPGGNYAYLRAAPRTPGGSGLSRTVNLPLRGNYQLQFSSPGAYTNRSVFYTATITDPSGSVLATNDLSPLSGDQINSSYFSVTNPGLCTLSFGNLRNFASPSNIVLLDNISITRTTFGQLANGDFEATPLSPGQYQYYGAQAQPVDSWAYAGDAGIASDSSDKGGFATGYPDVYARTNYAFLQTATGTPGSMEQSVVLPAQLVGPVLMSFSFAGRQAGPGFGGNASFKASVIDANGYTLVSTQLVTSSGQLFNNQTLAFSTVNKAPFTLRFDSLQNTSGADNTVFIDNVQVLAASQVSAAAPIITEEPASVTNHVSTAETLHGSAMLLSGEMPTYQWFEGSSLSPSNAVPVSGATNADLTLPATTNDYTRTFFLRAYNGPAHWSDSLTATVQIAFPPKFTSQPADQVLWPGQIATFSVAVSGTPPFTYQWFSGALGDTSNPVGTNSSYTTAPLGADATFWVRVLNDAGASYAVTSRLASVTILTQQLSGQTVCLGDPATFGFGVPSDVAVTIQWQRRVLSGSFTNIPGATAASYTIPAVSAADDGSFFRAVFNNSATNVVTAEAPLSVMTISAPTITYDFSSGLPTNTAIYGDARTTNGTLRLNHAVQWYYGFWLTADLAPGHAVRGFIAHFTTTISPDPLGTPMGDGFSFNWAPDLLTNVHFFVPSEQGEGSGLRVCFQTYDDGSGYAPCIDVKWGDNVVGHFKTTDAFLSNQGTNADVMIRLNTDGTFDMTYRCASIFTRLPMPGYQPQFNSRLSLDSRTDMYDEAVSIQNVSLQLFVDATNGVPGFTSMTPQGQSGLAINGAGTPNAQYPLFTSQDLVNWQFRTNVTLGSNGLFQFVEPDISSAAKQFYRLKAAPNLPAGLVSWWRGDGNYLDSFGGRNGSPSTNAPTFTAGMRTPAFNFRGTNGLSINSASLPAPWTLCFWAMGEANLNLPGPIQTVFSDTNSSLCLDADGNGDPGLRLSDGSVLLDQGFDLPTLYSPAHYTFVSDSTNLWLYVNGEQDPFFYPSGNFTLPLSVMGAGIDGVSNGLNQPLDEVMVFDRVLTPEEVYQVINATRAP
jgi:hypothetical protein